MNTYKTLPISERPCAAGGFISYRCKGRFSWIMIGARDDADALREARRSSDSIQPDTLERWNGDYYEPIARTQRFTLRGTYGDFVVDGRGVRVGPIENVYPYMVRIDLAEYRATYPKNTINEADVCDVAFWDADGNYEHASPDYREEVKKSAHGRGEI